MELKTPTNLARGCAWNSLCTGTGTGVRRIFFNAAPISKCEPNRDHVLLGAFAMDCSPEPRLYPSGKAKAETRVFVDSLLQQGAVIQLPYEEQKHLRARRFRNGDQLVLFNSAGQTAAAIYQNERVVILELRSSKHTDHSFSNLVAIPKKPSRADWLVEKLTELGADSINFMVTKRTIVTDPSPRKLQRWKRIAISASKQSMRTSTPEVSLIDFEAALKVTAQHPLALLLCPKGEHILSSSIQDIVKRKRCALLLVGPEGGFETRETNDLKDAGAIGVSLGGNRLRTETAAIASASILCQLF
ncbi:unnamed protein product [Agarophyton chilense]|eukprot:gb/GEZJ01000459.1/.p2 GENE.gb/GEZJ01000459.1/~~gb/GEZJ01000459.1/.p2  ORF type:complete len:302 (-),score=45.52 gb/GEZJ01000459.1/:904-1809(-)